MPLVPALAVRLEQQPGPCDPTPCYEVIDSAACWSTVLMGRETNATKMFDCVPGGKEEAGLTSAAIISSWGGSYLRRPLSSCAVATAAIAFSINTWCRTRCAAKVGVIHWGSGWDGGPISTAFDNAPDQPGLTPKATSVEWKDQIIRCMGARRNT